MSNAPPPDDRASQAPESLLSIPPSLDVAGNPRRVTAVGGGKGGVGKSIVAQSLAVYMAQLGKRVILVDADPSGANLHLSLGVERPGSSYATPHGELDEAIERALVPTNVPGLRMLVAPIEPSASGTIKTSRKARLLQGLRAVAADEIVVDVGPGTSTVASDLFLAADVGVLVTVPEPAAMETMYRFLRATYVRDLRRALRANRPLLRTLDRVLGETSPRGGAGLPAGVPPLLGGLHRPVELARYLARVDTGLGEHAAMSLARMRPRLVVNQTRVKSDLDLGAWVQHVAYRRIGIQIDPLGNVEHDDAVWLANRRRKPLLVDGPSSKAARGLERVARRLIAVFPHRAREMDAPGFVPDPPNHYDRLQIQRGAAEEEVRRAYKRQNEIFARDGLAVVSLFTPEELDREHALLDEAYDVLMDAQRRRAYDVSVFPNHASPHSAPTPASRGANEAIVAEMLQLQAQVARELGPDTEFSGELLRRVRESRGIDLKEIALRTKVSQAHLSAIELEAFDQLPQLVYVRGFLVELAKFLKLDPQQVARTYLRRAKDLIELRG
jgi:flagellar biosynthesis protein FlhG